MEVAKAVKAVEPNKQGATVTLLEVSPEPAPDTKPESPNAAVFAPQADAGRERSLQTPAMETQKSQSGCKLEGFSLEGKTCVVTGGASGIGLEVCRSIMTRGGNIAIVDLNAELAEKQAKELANNYALFNGEESPPLVTAHAADVSSPTSIEMAINSILEKHEKIDHLVTSAGICENFPAISYPYSRMRKLWSINVDGTYCFATAVARHLMQRKSGGSLVFIASMSGSIVNIPQPQTPYNVSKAAVRHMAKSLAVEWADFGIRVNCISPGYIKTALTEEIMNNDPALYENWISRTPLGRLGHPADIAGAAVFLLSDQSRFMTGAEMLIDGGYSAI